MNYRDYLQQLIYKIINPVVHGMIKVGITPNFITTTGLVLNIVAAVVFVYASFAGGDKALTCAGWAGGIVLFAGLFDMMDGRVARVGNMSSTFGALYDSVLDRYSELFTLFPFRHPLLSAPSGVFLGKHHYGGGHHRFAHGELCTCPCRRLGLGVQGGPDATSRACGADSLGCHLLWRFSRLHSIR